MTDLFDQNAVPLHEQIACVEREIKQRIRVYARLVAEGKMTVAKSDAELAAMRAVLLTVQAAVPVMRVSGIEMEDHSDLAPDALKKVSP